MTEQIISSILLALFAIWLLFVVVMIIRLLNHESISELSPPVELDQDNQKDLHEAKVIQYQNTLGRELNGFRWKGGDQ